MWRAGTRLTKHLWSGVRPTSHEETLAWYCKLGLTALGGARQAALSELMFYIKEDVR